MAQTGRPASVNARPREGASATERWGRPRAGGDNSAQSAATVVLDAAPPEGALFGTMLHILRSRAGEGGKPLPQTTLGALTNSSSSVMSRAQLDPEQPQRRDGYKLPQPHVVENLPKALAGRLAANGVPAEVVDTWMSRLKEAYYQERDALRAGAAKTDDGEPEPPSVARISPNALPVVMSYQVGRDREWVSLMRRWSEIQRRWADGTANGPWVAIIDGGAGTGKSTMAVRFARTIRAGTEFDAVLHVRLCGSETDESGRGSGTCSALRFLLRQMGFPTEHPSVEDLSAVWQSVTADRRVLVVLDQATDDEQVRRLLPTGAGSAAIVTSRHILPRVGLEVGAARVTLLPLARDASIALLEEMIGDRAIEDPASTERLAALCGDLPLALAAAAAKLNAQPRTSLAGQVTELEEDRLTALVVGEDPQEFRQVWTSSYAALAADRPELAAVYRMVGLCPAMAPIRPELIASLTGRDVSDAAAALHALHQRGWVEAGAHGAYEINALAHAYVVELGRSVDTTAARRTATSKLVDWYAVALTAAEAAVIPTRSPAVYQPVTTVVAPTFSDAGAARAFTDAAAPAVPELVTLARQVGRLPAAERIRDAAAAITGSPGGRVARHRPALTPVTAAGLSHRATA